VVNFVLSHYPEGAWVNEYGGLQPVICAFTAQVARSLFTQFIIERQDQLIESRARSVAQFLQQSGYLNRCRHLHSLLGLKLATGSLY
jgi:hypothetical protein